MKHDPRTRRLQHQEACILLAAIWTFKREPFTRGEMSAKTGFPIPAVCGRIFTLLARGALEECGRRGRSALLRIVIKPGKRRKG